MTDRKTWRKVIGDAWGVCDLATAWKVVDPTIKRATTQAAYDAGLTFAQIAEAAGVSISTVYALIGKQGQRASLDDEVPV